MLAQSMVAALDHRSGGAREAERKRRDVGGRRTRGVPGCSSAVASHPLLGKGCLPVSGRSNEHTDARLRLVEQREQSRSLDDPALADPCFWDCRRRGLPLLTDVTLNAATLTPHRRGARGRRSCRERPGSAGEPSRDHVAAPRRQRILAGEQPVGDRDLAATPHAELLPKHVAMGLRRPGGNAESQADLVVRATRCDECDDLALPRRYRGRPSLRSKVDHGARSYSLVRVTAIRQGV